MHWKRLGWIYANSNNIYESETTERLNFHFSLSLNGEGNGNPLQCSCLENPRDGRAWWAAVYEVAQSQTRLKWLSNSSSSSHNGIRHLCVIWNFSHNKRVAFVIKAINICYAVLCHSAVSVSLWPRGLKPARLLCPWGFSRQEYWTGLPCPPPGDLPNPRIEPRSPTLQADSLPAELPGNL